LAVGFQQPDRGIVGVAVVGMIALHGFDLSRAAEGMPHLTSCRPSQVDKVAIKVGFQNPKVR
jgi:hypothetical protein